jgi:hypothetical protein
MSNDDGFVNKKMLWHLPFIHKNAPLHAKSSRIQKKASKLQIPITAQPQHRSTITVFISCFRTYALPLDLRHDSMITKIWNISHSKFTDFGSRLVSQ